MGRPRKPDGERVRDIAPTAIRLPPELRDALFREAEINRRTLSGEIVLRLRHTFAQQEAGHAVTTAEPKASYAIEPANQVLTDAERMALTLFRGMSPDKQLALLTVLRR